MGRREITCSFSVPINRRTVANPRVQVGKRIYHWDKKRASFCFKMYGFRGNFRNQTVAVQNQKKQNASYGDCVRHVLRMVWHRTILCRTIFSDIFRCIWKEKRRKSIKE